MEASQIQEPSQIWSCLQQRALTVGRVEGGSQCHLGAARSSLHLFKGIRVSPGVIDADHTGELKIMVEATQGILVILQGERIAQLILLPLVETGHSVLKTNRGSGGFGSTGCPQAFWVAELLHFLNYH